MSENTRVIIVAITVNADIGASADGIADMIIDELRGSLTCIADDAEDLGSGEDHQWEPSAKSVTAAHHGRNPIGAIEKIPCKHCSRVPRDHERSIIDVYGHFSFWLSSTMVVKP